MKHKAVAADIDITYIVSAFNRPLMLPCCLWSIAGQSHQNFECIVADNADHEPTAALHKRAVDEINRIPGLKGKFIYARTHGKTKVSDCYWAAEWVNKNLARGRWLCFPCDDVYLVPEYGQRMLSEAHREQADFVYCKWIVVGPVASGDSGIPPAGYRVWEMKLHRTAKSCFIVRRSIFPGFHGKLDRTGYVNADYFFSTQMAQSGRRIARLDDLLATHN